MGWGWGRYGGYGRYGRAPKATKASAATLSTATLQRVLAQKQAQEQYGSSWMFGLEGGTILAVVTPSFFLSAPQPPLPQTHGSSPPQDSSLIGEGVLTTQANEGCSRG